MTAIYARELFLKTFGREPTPPKPAGQAAGSPVPRSKMEPADDNDDDQPDETDEPGGDTQQSPKTARVGEGESKPAAPADRIIYHVMLRKNDRRWNVLKQGRAKPNRVLDSQAEAIEFAMTLARSEGEAWVITHTEDGTIAEEIHVKP